MSKNDIPEMPPEILARRPIPLTDHAAENTSANHEPTPPIAPKGKVNAGLAAYRARQKAAKASAGGKVKGAKGKEVSAEDQKALNNPNPHYGLKREEVWEISGRTYAEEGAPEMDGELGDRTPAFREWVKANHPKDYAVRYYAR